MSKTIFNVLVISKGFSLLSRLMVSFSGPPEAEGDGLAALHTEPQLNNIISATDNRTIIERLLRGFIYSFPYLVSGYELSLTPART